MSKEQQTYIGVKILTAIAMTLGAYNAFRGWDIPKDEDPEKEGYLVTYPDGYQSWSPKAAFDDAYRPVHPTKLQKAKDMAAELLRTAESACVKPPPMLQALTGKRHADMLALVESGEDVEAVADIFEVDPKYVATEVKKAKADKKRSKPPEE